jgi:Kef-type K+ transport system membrane component KefB
LLIQIIVIVLTARTIGFLFQKINQPAVVGEMVAGILLGPSLLGVLSPQIEAFLFPIKAMGILQMLSQVGIILFMFAVGVELDLKPLRRQTHAAVMISHAGILFPFLLGTALSLFLFSYLPKSNIPFNAFALFMGIAMSITAFPVLARIIEERGLSKSPLGTTAIACAAVDDVSAWCILAIVIAVAKSQGLSSALLTILLAVVFVLAMVFLIKPRADRLLGTVKDSEVPGKGIMVSVFIFAFASALFTEAIGIHVLFGAFLAGIAMPNDSVLRHHIKQNIEVFTSAFLLPLFFAYTGLRTQLGLITTWQSWLICIGIILVAITGKLGGSTFAARLAGMSWHDALSIGTLMNTRGLMELIALNIGYDLGILPPQIFTMMVLMAISTTFMTGPLLSILGSLKQRDLVQPIKEEKILTDL